MHQFKVKPIERAGPRGGPRVGPRVGPRGGCVVKTHPQFRDAHEAFVASVDALVAAHGQPGTLDAREALERETARRIASFTQRLCAEEVL